MGQDTGNPCEGILSLGSWSIGPRLSFSLVGATGVMERRVGTHRIDFQIIESVGFTTNAGWINATLSLSVSLSARLSLFDPLFPILSILCCCCLRGMLSNNCSYAQPAVVERKVRTLHHPHHTPSAAGTLAGSTVDWPHR